MRSYLYVFAFFFASLGQLESVQAGQPDHGPWDALLQKYVTPQGKVDYKGWQADKAKLQAYLDQLAAHPADASWPENVRLAYWINAYNAFTVKLILDNYPLKSITDLHSGNPWDVKWIKLGNTTYSLNQIEHEIIRPQFKEPRIHFAVNCAARSCPPLLNRAYTAQKLEQQLEQQTKAFISDAQYNRIQPDRLELSKIFEWYSDDFSNLIAFLNKYSENRIRSNAKINYQDYNWALNRQ